MNTFNEEDLKICHQIMINGCDGWACKDQQLPAGKNICFLTTDQCIEIQRKIKNQSSTIEKQIMKYIIAEEL